MDDMDNSPLFPHDILGRLALLLSSILFVPIGGMGAYMFLVKARPQGWAEWLMIRAAGNLLLALALFFTCGFIWAMTTPRWLENLLQPVARRLVLALAAFAIPFGVMTFWALLNGI
jgi:hypothetical protein